MKTLTLQEYDSITKRNREGVASKLRELLNAELPKLKAGAIVEIDAKDFLESADFHYYGARKLIDAEFSKKIDAKFILKEHGRAEKLIIKVK